MSSHAHGLRASELRRKFNGFGPAAKTWGRHNNQQWQRTVTERANADNKRRRLTRTRHFVRPVSRFEPQRDQLHVLSHFALFIPQYSAAQDSTAQHRPHWWHSSHRVYLSAIYSSRAATAPVPVARWCSLIMIPSYRAQSCHGPAQRRFALSRASAPFVQEQEGASSSWASHGPRRLRRRA
jgi:hypothetical protein